MTGGWRQTGRRPGGSRSATGGSGIGWRSPPAATSDCEDGANMTPGKPLDGDLSRFLREHATFAHDDRHRTMLLSELPRSAEYVLDLADSGERILVGSVLDTLSNAFDSALF